MLFSLSHCHSPLSLFKTLTFSPLSFSSFSLSSSSSSSSFSFNFIHASSRRHPYLLKPLFRPFVRFMSYKQIIVTDPCFVSSKSNYDQVCQRHLAWSSTHQQELLQTTSCPNHSSSSPSMPPPNVLVEFRITPELYSLLENAPTETNYSMASRVTDETYYTFGEASTKFSDYQFIGLHGSDSRMTCIVPKDPFERSKDLFGIENMEDIEVDWDDFAMTTLNDPQLQVDRDDYPLYFFFSVIPEEDTELAVFGLPVSIPTASESKTSTIYKGFILRSKDAVLENKPQQ